MSGRRVGHGSAVYPGTRVSTEDWQDPVTSRARQRDQAGVLVARRGIIVAEFFDSGHSRTLRWAKSALEGDPNADPPVPPHVDVWRSARADDDTKTRKSRRSLGMPRMAVAALREHLERQAARRQAGVLWEDNGLVFTAALGTQLDAADDTVSVDHANRSFVT